MGIGRRTLRTAAVAVLLPAAAAAQAGERPVCDGGAKPVGSLGITGISCERCQFFTNGKVHRAVFWTEPTILDLNGESPASAVLRKGDVLVAVDGRLITTREGSARFSALPPDEPARLRVRRAGRLVELTVPVAAECPAKRSAEVPVVAGRPVPAPPPLPPTAVVVEAPAPARVSAAPMPPDVAGTVEIAELPAAPPAPEQMEPRASLGFGFRCGPCVYHGEGAAGRGRWTFSEPPEVIGVDETGRGGSGGLRRGDRLLAVDGLELTSEEGGRRFANIRPGETLRWTIERDGRRMDVTTRAQEPRTVVSTAPVVVDETPPTVVSEVAVGRARAPLRFSGMVGNTTVEVRGGRVNVTEDEGGRLVIIRTGDAEIRIRVAGREGG